MRRFLILLALTLFTLFPQHEAFALKRVVELLAAGVTDDTGEPLAAGTVTVYDAGTTSLRTVYTDFALSSAASNPLTLDSAGRAVVYTDKRVKLLIKNSSGATVRTIDNVGTADSDLPVASTNTLAGDGLTAPGDGSLAVNPDGTTLEISTDIVRVKDGGITGTKWKKTTVSKTTTYTATTSDDTILCSASGGAWTLSLPAAASSAGKIFTIKKTDSSTNAITIDGSGSETIDGALTKLLVRQYQWYEITCDGSAWYITNQGGPLGQQVSSSSGNFGSTSATPTAVTNLTVTLKSSGNPIRVFLQNDGSQMTGSYISGVATTGNNNLTILRDGATIAGFGVPYAKSVPTSVVDFLDTGITAGTAHTYTVKVESDGSNNFFVNYAKLVAYEVK
jgi:hypothetical protein